MPWNEVMHKFAQQKLHSGSKKGPVVKNRKQALAIMISERSKSKSNPDYRANLKAAIKGR